VEEANMQQPVLNNGFKNMPVSMATEGYNDEERE
jgi:hypothetical protein